MKIIKGGKSDHLNDDYESDKEYAQLLKTIIDKYFGNNIFERDLNFIYDIARFCWNFAIITPINDKKFIKDFKAILEDFDLEKVEIKTFIDFTKELSVSLDKFNRLIKDFDIEVFGEGNYHVIVKTISQDDFIVEAQNENFDELDDELDDELEFGPNFISRSLLILKPKSAFTDLFNGKTKKGFIELNSTRAVLIGELEDVNDLELAFEGFEEELFEYLFITSGIRAKDKPKKLSFKLFTEWFEYELLPDVFDTGFGPVFKG